MGVGGRQSRKRNHHDEVPQRPSVSPQAQTPNDLIEQTTNNELHANDSTGASELSEDDLPRPAEENASTEKNVATEEDRSVVGRLIRMFQQNLILTIGMPLKRRL